MAVCICTSRTPREASEIWEVLALGKAGEAELCELQFATISDLR